MTGPVSRLDEPGAQLAVYDRACAALAEAKRVDEVKDIIDASVAIRALARQAKNFSLEQDAVELRMRATRRLDQMRQAQAATVGLNRGAAAGGEKDGPRGSLVNPRDLRPTLASQGIDKQLAHLELFARKPRPGWKTWGDAIAREQTSGDEAPAAIKLDEAQLAAGSVAP